MMFIQVFACIHKRYQSGGGQPPSNTSRKERHARKRASVLECGCPLPLSYVVTLSKGISVPLILLFGVLLFEISALAQTRVKLSSIKPGTEQVQLIPNGDFQFQGTLVGTNYPSPIGCSRSGDMYAIGGTNTVLYDNGVVA